MRQVFLITLTADIVNLLTFPKVSWKSTTSCCIQNWITTTCRSHKIGLRNTSKKILKSLAMHTTIMLKGLYQNLSIPICTNVKMLKITKQQQWHLMHIEPLQSKYPLDMQIIL